ncbi:putative fasciclin-like arabinogalactan protein 20 [Chenopodium quinoa]|uniref:FAS1 domain-containing protein n=1 Tax=Chenopodium quinoa TaxID=63459 RepID=A0A803N2Z7_CHEQI|nr:putative fasciclin-like arabinogalactan protein 20 [Chenopodium quinoa]
MAFTSITIFSLLTFSLLIPHLTAISDESINNAAEILSDSGFNSMSLILPFISQPLISSLSSATLFTPSDSSFSLSNSGQPSLSLLQFHFCPRFYSFVDLQSLSYGTQLNTLLPNSSLSITSSDFDEDVAINGVKLNSSPVFDDGFFIIFQIDRFFNPNLTVGSTTELGTPSLSPIPSPPECAALSPRSGKYRDASASLRSRGYSLMAAFLDMQLTQFDNNNDKSLTLFAPTDASMEGHFGKNNYSEWGSIFLRHTVGCELSWGDLIGQLDQGFVIPTFLNGFQINVSRSNVYNSAYSLMINGQVSVDFPEFYRNHGIVVHGLSGVLVSPAVNEEREDAYSPANAFKVDADHIEF